MINIWLKKHIFQLITWAFIMGSFFTVLYTNIYLSKYIPIKEELSMYENSLFDYVLMDISHSQATDILNRNDVQAISPTYIFDDIVFSYGEVSSGIFFTSREALQISIFGESRIIEVSDIHYDYPIFLTYSVAKNNGLKLDESISIAFGPSHEIFEFHVEAIYEDNYLLGREYGHLFLWNTELEAATIGTNLFYNMTYIKMSQATFSQYVEDFVPLARAPKPDQFSTSEQYQNALNDYMNRSYENSKISRIYALETLQVRYDTRLLNYDAQNKVLWAGLFLLTQITFIGFHLIQHENLITLRLLGLKTNKIFTIKIIEISLFSTVLCFSGYVWLYFWSNRFDWRVSKSYFFVFGYSHFSLWILTIVISAITILLSRKRGSI